MVYLFHHCMYLHVRPGGFFYSRLATFGKENILFLLPFSACNVLIVVPLF